MTLGRVTRCICASLFNCNLLRMYDGDRELRLLTLYLLHNSQLADVQQLGLAVRGLCDV